MANFIVETLLMRFVPKEVRNERRGKCEVCPLNDNGICTKKEEINAVSTFEYKGNMRLQGQLYKGCGCDIAWKTTLINEKCPTGKW